MQDQREIWVEHCKKIDDPKNPVPSLSAWVKSLPQSVQENGKKMFYGKSKYA